MAPSPQTHIDPALAVRRIACVGDSITRGTFVRRRRTRSYPAQLQVMLGERFCVGNFGVNGHAAQQNADRPYRSSSAFTRSIAFEPDTVLLMLGTNDVRGDNWKGVESFTEDYRDLVQLYREAPTRPRVWLLTPPALFRVHGRQEVLYRMDDSALTLICDAIAAVGRDLGCDVIDIHAATAQHPEAFRFDGVHPGGAGATLIAQAVYDALTSSA